MKAKNKHLFWESIPNEAGVTKLPHYCKQGLCHYLISNPPIGRHFEAQIIVKARASNAES